MNFLKTTIIIISISTILLNCKTTRKTKINYALEFVTIPTKNYIYSGPDVNSFAQYEIKESSKIIVKKISPNVYKTYTGKIKNINYESILDNNQEFIFLKTFKNNKEVEIVTQVEITPLNFKNVTKDNSGNYILDSINSRKVFVDIRRGNKFSELIEINGQRISLGSYCKQLCGLNSAEINKLSFTQRQFDKDVRLLKKLSNSIKPNIIAESLNSILLQYLNEVKRFLGKTKFDRYVDFKKDYYSPNKLMNTEFLDLWKD